jgi:predicted kinase
MATDWVGDLILLRGLPGAGKTTLAEVILQSSQGVRPDVISADNYFMDDKGNYNFDVSKIKETHNSCQQICAERMRLEFSKVVVANTFTEQWEMEPYFEMAERYNYRVHSVIIENRHDGKNIHNVPEDKLKQMKNRFQIIL